MFLNVIEIQSFFAIIFMFFDAILIPSVYVDKIGAYLSIYALSDLFAYFFS
jgi:hypothetical protein